MHTNYEIPPSEHFDFGNEQQPVGEYPDVPCTSSAAAFDALDSLCQELEALKKANAELLQENTRLTNERDRVLYERDTARAADMRRGW